jgi:hypothetical protein
MTMAADTRPPAPWYRQRWPWLLIAGPAIVVVAALFTAWLAATTDDGVIADDYYKRGLLVNKEIDRLARARALGMGATLRVTPDGAVTLELRGRDDPAAAPPTVRLLLAHPTRAGRDRSVVLTRGPDGVYVGAMGPRPAGRWLVTVETDAWRLPTMPTTDGLDALVIEPDSARRGQ